MEVGLSIAQMQRGMDVEGFYLLKTAFAKVTASGPRRKKAVAALRALRRKLGEG